MTDPLELVRGDRQTLDLTDLLDKDDAPATFNVDDELIFTAKHRYADSDADAILQIEGAAITLSGSSATIVVVGSDWPSAAFTRDTQFVWDVQLAVHGDPDQIVTLDRGRGVIKADTTLSVTVS